MRIDETFFLGGVEKSAVLAAFGAHIFFDDQRSHVVSAARLVPSAQVLRPGSIVQANDYLTRVSDQWDKSIAKLRATVEQ